MCCRPVFEIGVDNAFFVVVVVVVVDMIFPSYVFDPCSKLVSTMPFFFPLSFPPFFFFFFFFFFLGHDFPPICVRPVFEIWCRQRDLAGDAELLFQYSDHSVTVSKTSLRAASASVV